MIFDDFNILVSFFGAALLRLDVVHHPGGGSVAGAGSGQILAASSLSLSD